jgi:hypothetical protein
MYWPFKTTVRFHGSQDEIESRLDYLVSAGNSIEAKLELERRLLAQEVFGYKIESVVAATSEEAAKFTLPAGCVMLLG